MPAARRGRLVAFLRAINVGGRVVTMDRLRALFEDLGAREVETFIASGNVIFGSSARDPAALERRIEGHLWSSLGYEVKTFIRTEAEVAAIAGYRPFRDNDVRAAKAFCVGFLAAPPGAAARKSLMALRTTIDDFHVHRREVYWLCRARQGESTFSNAVLEKTLGVSATIRGVSTVVRLADKYGFPRPTAEPRR